MSRSVSRFLPVALIVASGCVANGSPVRLGPNGVATGVNLGWSRKRIVTKQPPETLVAEDGTVCRVAPDRFRDTDAHAVVDCDWQLGEPVPR